MAKRHIIYPAPRVAQVDADILDGELFSLLKQQLSDVFLLLTNKSWTFDLHPELWSLGLKLSMFWLTTYKSGSSYGHKLQNLKLSDSKTGRVIGKRTRICILSIIIGEYFVKKLQSYLFSLPDNSRNGNSFFEKVKEAVVRRRHQIIKRADEAIKILGLVNFLTFLVYGKFPSLLHRVLGVSLTPVIPDLLKFNGDKVSFEFQNRQLVWNVMTEFLVFILPLLQLHKWKKLTRLLIPKQSGSNHLLVSLIPVETRFLNLPQSQCAICIESIEASGIKAASTFVTNPHITNCGHIYCYICLASRFSAAESGHEEAEGCPRCRLRIENFKPYGELETSRDSRAIIVEYDEVEEESSLSDVEVSHEKVEGALTDSGAFIDLPESVTESEGMSEEDYSEHEDLEEEDLVESAFDDDDDEYDDDDDDVFME